MDFDDYFTEKEKIDRAISVLGGDELQTIYRKLRANYVGSARLSQRTLWREMCFSMSDQETRKKIMVLYNKRYECHMQMNQTRLLDLDAQISENTVTSSNHKLYSVLLGAGAGLIPVYALHIQGLLGWLIFLAAGIGAMFMFRGQDEEKKRRRNEQYVSGLRQNVRDEISKAESEGPPFLSTELATGERSFSDAPITQNIL